MYKDKDHQRWALLHEQIGCYRAGEWKMFDYQQQKQKWAHLQAHSSQGWCMPWFTEIIDYCLFKRKRRVSEAVGKERVEWKVKAHISYFSPPHLPHHSNDQINNRILLFPLPLPFHLPVQASPAAHRVGWIVPQEARSMWTYYPNLNWKVSFPLFPSHSSFVPWMAWSMRHSNGYFIGGRFAGFPQSWVALDGPFLWFQNHVVLLFWLTLLCDTKERWKWNLNRIFHFIYLCSMSEVSLGRVWQW